MVEHERPAVTEDIALPPVSASFAKSRGLIVLELIGVRPVSRNATATAPANYLKKPH